MKRTRPLTLPKDRIALEEPSGRVAAHVFDEPMIDAVNLALAANRPLLVRGEPGSGKSQLARAVAKLMKRPFIAKVVDASTEATELLYDFDAVSRLAKAQLMAAVGHVGVSDPPYATEGDEPQRLVEEKLHEKHFTRPGPLWWAFHWESAAGRTKALRRATPPAPGDWSYQTGGVVVLIDEIDKADGTVPNGLLGALGSGWFDEPGGVRVEVNANAEAPLIVVTTNEERVLPDAFVRRCVVLQFDVGDVRTPDGRKKFVQLLTTRGRAHHPEVDVLSDEILNLVAEQLVKDRVALLDRRLGLPGVAEYLDLLWGLRELTNDTRDARAKEKAQKALLERLAAFVFDKHPPRENR